MQLIKTPRAMQRASQLWHKNGRSVGFVPTMGYLHEGHLSLVRAARKKVGSKGVVVVSIYVNPTQFGPTEDLSRYPRDFKRDVQLCAEAGVDAIFCPSDAAMYPGRAEGRYSTYVTEETLSKSMEGVSRPTHFRGVTTVVAKLFLCVQPDVAVFGAKDWQQAAVVQRMVADLNFPLKLVVAPTLRERDGLAMSSRNTYLTPEERRQATVLWRSIQWVRSRVRAMANGKIVRGKRGADEPEGIPAEELRQEVAGFVSAEPSATLDYVEFFHPTVLEPVQRVMRGTQMALAVRVGKTRLIDNGRL